MTASHRPSRPLAIAAGVLGVLGACAYVVRRKTAQVEAENPPQGRFINVDGVRLHLVERGDPTAPALLVVHGLGATLAEMELSGFIDLAAKSYRVLLFDRPGYGYSERPAGRTYTPEVQADLLFAALDQLGVDKPVVLGHSWGALVAKAMGVRRPERLAAVVLASGYHTPSARVDVLWESAPALPVIGTLMRHTVSPLLGRLFWPLFVKRMFAPAPTAPAFDQGYPIWMSLRPGQLLAAAEESAMLIPRGDRLQKQESRLTVPLVIVAGEKDRLLMTFWHSEGLHERMPDSRLRIVPGAGHMVHHTAPHKVLAAVEEASALARLGPAATRSGVPSASELVNAV